MSKVLALGVFLSAISLAQDQKAETVEQLVKGIANWNSELNTPGSSMELRELNREKKNGAILVSYSVRVTGVPKDQSYALFYWPINRTKPEVTVPEVWLGEDGSVCVDHSSCAATTLRFSFLAARGEPHRLMMISKDGKHHVVAMVIPDPITAIHQGCSIEVIRASPKFELALVRGRGFKPGDHVEFTSNSAGERRQGVSDVKDDGTFLLVLEPFVKGKDNGRDEVKFKGENCSPTTAFKWGTMED